MSGGGSVYAQKGSTTGSVYAQKGASSGSVYANNGASAAAPKKHGHGGLLGAVEHAAHWTAEKAGLAAHDVKTIPGGIVGLSEGLARDLHDLVPNAAQGISAGFSGAGGGGASAKQPQAPFARTTKNLQGMGQGAVTSLEHPLRDPFQTLSTLAAVTGGVGSVAGRAAEVGRAAKAGASAGDIAKAAVRKPPVRPRLLTVGGTQVPLHPSANPTVRAGQGLYDRVLQRGLDKNPEGRVAAHAGNRIGGSFRETGRYQERMRAVPADLLEQAAKRLAPTRGHVPFTGAKRLQRVEQAAMELTSVNTPPELASAYHLAQAEKGVNPGLNRAVAKLYDTVHKRGMLTTNEHGDVIVNAAKHPKIAVADARLAEVQKGGDEVLKRYGVRDAEALQAAVNAPGRYRAGATYEKPTPGKAGKSPAVDAAARRVGRLQTHFDRLYEKQRGKIVTTQRPLTVDEAHAELAKLTKVHNAALDKIAGRMFGPIDRGEVNFRTAQNRKAAQQASGASGYKATTRPTVVEERRAHAEKAVGEMIAKNPEHPTAAQWSARANRIDQLQAALHPDIFEKVNPAALGTADVSKFVPRRGQINRVGGALSIAKDELQRLEQQAAGRVKPTGIVGGAEARPGRGYVSYAGSEPKAPRSVVASSAGPVVGEAKAPVTSHANQGINIGLGKVPKDVTGQAARHYRQIVRFVNTTEYRNAALRTGSAVRRTSRDVLVSIPGETHAKIPAAVNEILGKTKLTHDDVQGIHAALQAYKEDLVPGLQDNFAADRQHGIGTAAPEGRMWVDKNVLGDLAKPGAGPRGKIARSVDNVNSAVTAATVYFKIGHVGTRALTNAATNIIQGSAHPIEVAKSFKLWDKLGDNDRLRALAAAGQHGFQAMPHEGTSRVARIAGSGANFWARRFDSPFRFNQIAYEARRAGFDTPAKFRQMLDRMENPEGLNAAEQAKVDYVAKRANREGIAYDRLSEFERRYLARALWFYPWLKGTVGFAANTAMEHPFKAAALGKLGEQGRQTQQQQLGDLPSFEHGLYQLAGPDASGKPLVADFSTFSPFATPADIGEAVTHPAELSGFLNPVGTAGTNLMFGLNQYGSKSQSPLEDAAASLASPTPEAQILSAFLQRHKDQSKRMFPKSSAWYGTHDPVVRALLGPGTPRRLNPAAAHSTAARERSGR